MKRLLIVGVALGVGLLAWHLASKSEGLNWETMLERMPDSTPPKRLFASLAAIRENTYIILQRLKRAHTVEVNLPDPPKHWPQSDGHRHID
jgi:hypothetical protein